MTNKWRGAPTTGTKPDTIPMLSVIYKNNKTETQILQIFLIFFLQENIKQQKYQNCK